MVLNNVTKVHKILIKNIRVRERMSSGQTYVITYVRMDRGNTLCPGHYHGGGIKNLIVNEKNILSEQNRSPDKSVSLFLKFIF